MERKDERTKTTMMKKKEQGKRKNKLEVESMEGIDGWMERNAKKEKKKEIR